MKQFLFEHHFTLILVLTATFLCLHGVIGLIDSIRHILIHEPVDQPADSSAPEEKLQSQVQTVLTPVRRVALAVGFYGAGGSLARGMHLTNPNCELMAALSALSILVGLHLMMSIFCWIDAAQESQDPFPQDGPSRS